MNSVYARASIITSAENPTQGAGDITDSTKSTRTNNANDATDANDATLDDMAERKKRERLARKKTGGIVMVYTGNGKGKTSAGIGLIGRALGHKRKVAVMQFVKGRWISGERRYWQKVATSNHDLQWRTMGQGFSWVTKDRDIDLAAATKAWQEVKLWLIDSAIDLVILDELNIVLHQGLLSVDEVLLAVDQRPAAQSVVITGRHAHPRIIDYAHMVSELVGHKHHMGLGYRAQPGIEF